ncbi:hypothetical protein MON38_20255 [Hymenobacter sp. DH14]|uniref:Uncharacterized protein n=1 Tax=Hymenobacter cyanobacteriorum TaxID=2926463 RepID=A0A9X1VJ39_9BACT|nr:hypothetical protein [Hymenobacter cyanobacteriorum]MCI1189762.1 hypothetical protein [Hymenobacter cyanobacteriorum]
MPMPNPEKTPVQLFDLLLELMLTKDMPEVLVASRLKSFVQGSRREPERLGRTYFICKGLYFTLTATFEKPSFCLYQITARLTPTAYAHIKAHAQALPQPGTVWKNSWLGLWPQLQVSRGDASRPAVTARFMGLLPGQKFIVLTRS